MGRIVASFFTTVDGVVEAPHRWHFPYFDAAMGEVVGAGMQQTQAFLMGRGLYDEWSQYWPGNTTDEFAGFINTIPKHVLSNSLTEATWEGTTLVSGSEDEVAAQVQELKDATDGTIAMSGCATTVRWLLARGLLDELELLVDPIAYVDGARLFADGPAVPLRLVHSQALPTGVLHVRYAPAEQPAG